MTGLVLALNAGSSSLKFALFAIEGSAPVLVGKGQVDGIGGNAALVVDGRVEPIDTPASAAVLAHEDFLTRIFAWAENKGEGRPLLAIGHRIVHGGSSFAAPVPLDDATLAALDALAPLAPLHQPHNLAAVRAARAVRPEVPQIGCFDTAFHHGLPEVATRYALPEAIHEVGIRRYGFHGLSYEFLARRLTEIDPVLAQGRVLMAHLGNGASLCAVRDGRSVGTSMGFTAIDGLMMGTRCGALDPGLVLHLIQQRGMSVEAVAHMLWHESGLLGVSGLSNDMRTLLASDLPEAARAVDLFCRYAVREAGALVAEMGGLDAFIFSGGIGEHAAPVRARIAGQLRWMGLTIDEAANDTGAALISASESAVSVRIIPTNEEQMIAQHCLEILEMAV